MQPTSIHGKLISLVRLSKVFVEVRYGNTESQHGCATGQKRSPNERPRTDMERHFNSMRKRSGDNIMKTMIVMDIAAAAVIRRADTNSVGLNSSRLANTISAIPKLC